MFRKRGDSMCFLGAAMLCIALGGCFQTPQEMAAKDDETCRNYGAKPGTDVYVQCRIAQDQRRDESSKVTGPAAPPPTADYPRLSNSNPPNHSLPVCPIGHGNAADGLPVNCDRIGTIIKT
jgi:hypothetical protein